jgi:ribosomal protein S27E
MPLRDVPRRPASLICMRFADMRVLHDETNTEHTCALCGHTLGIYPSGMRAIREHPGITLLCQVCGTPTLAGNSFGPAPGALDEIGQGKRRQ